MDNRSSPTTGNFFAALKTFNANIDNTCNLVLIVKNSNDQDII